MTRWWCCLLVSVGVLLSVTKGLVAGHSSLEQFREAGPTAEASWQCQAFVGQVHSA